MHALSYTTDNGISWNNLMMENLTSTLHQATIPKQPYGVSVKYRIIVYDNAENAVAEDRNGEYYVYQVIPEFPSLLVLPLFMTATLLAAITLRKKISSRKRSCMLVIQEDSQISCKNRKRVLRAGGNEISEFFGQGIQQFFVWSSS